MAAKWHQSPKFGPYVRPKRCVLLWPWSLSLLIAPQPHTSCHSCHEETWGRGVGGLFWVSHRLQWIKMVPVEVVRSHSRRSTSESGADIIASFPLCVCVCVGLFSLHMWRCSSIASELVWSLCWPTSIKKKHKKTLSPAHGLPWQLGAHFYWGGNLLVIWAHWFSAVCYSSNRTNRVREAVEGFKDDIGSSYVLTHFIHRLHPRTSKGMKKEFNIRVYQSFKITYMLHPALKILIIPL